MFVAFWSLVEDSAITPSALFGRRPPERVVGIESCPANLGRACITTAIIILISAVCGVCGAGIAAAVDMVVWPESKTQTEA